MFTTKSVFITGASRGIGRAIALEFANISPTIFFTTYNKNVEAMEEVHKLIMSKGCINFPFKVNVTNRRDINNMIRHFVGIDTKFGIDVLVNNVGILRDRTLKNMTDEEWDEVIGVNLTGVYNITKAILPYMNNGGCIVNITSMSGLTGNFGQCNYASAKAGVIGFTKSLAKELGRNKIRVNVVVVGLCDTDMSRSIPKVAIDSFIERMPLKRMSTPEEVAKIVKFICDDSYCTGAMFDVSGGLI